MERSIERVRSKAWKRTNSPVVRVVLVVLVATGLLAGCETEELITDSATSKSLELVSGDVQAGETRGLLKKPFVVRALDAQEQPMAGVIVDWVIRKGRGHLSVQSSVTDTEGIASATYTLGPEAGISVVEATIKPSGSSASFRAINFPATKESSAVYMREHSHRDGSYSRYVLDDSGRFELQLASFTQGLQTHEGTYQGSGSEVTFKFNDSSSYTATGELEDGRLDVRYNINMVISQGFEGGVYVLVNMESGDDNGGSPPGPGEFPPVLESDAVYGRASPTRFGHDSRFLFFADGSFDLQTETEWGWHTYSGTYRRTGYEIAFEWEGWSAAGPWEATATIDGNRIHVEYNIVMWLTDFDPGTYELESGEGF